MIKLMRFFLVHAFLDCDSISEMFEDAMVISPLKDECAIEWRFGFVQTFFDPAIAWGEKNSISALALQVAGQLAWCKLTKWMLTDKQVSLAQRSWQTWISALD